VEPPVLVESALAPDDVLMLMWSMKFCGRRFASQIGFKSHLDLTRDSRGRGGVNPIHDDDGSEAIDHLDKFRIVL
jgi:hypothetical protein